jgi:uncharacterized protein (TIGR03083 family)
MTAGIGGPPSAALRERVLMAARAARAPGRPVPGAPEISPAKAFGRAADALFGLLCTLDDAQWQAPVLRDLDVQGLVGHLVWVERDVHRAVAGEPAVAQSDHVASTQSVAEAQVGVPPHATLQSWREAADHTLGLVPTRRRNGDVVSMHGMRLPVGSLLVVRAFELWTHENDIRIATSLPASVPDDSTLRLMADLAVALLPRGAERAGRASAPVDVHLVLLGGGGGTWDVAVGRRPAGDPDHVPEIVLVVDVVDFCRLVAARVRPDELELRVTGAGSRLDDVLASAAALALD